MKNFLKIISEWVFREEKTKEEIVLFSKKGKYRKLTVVDKPFSDERIMYAAKRLFVAGIIKKTGFPLLSPYFIADFVNKKPESLLFIGGGPEAVPSYIWKEYKPKYIDIVERDKLASELAKQYFRSPTDKNYNVINNDVLNFLNSQSRKYDVIFSNIGLTRKRGMSKKDLGNFISRKSFGKMANLLNSKGVLLFLAVSKLQDRDLTFLKKINKNISKVFKSVFIFSDFQDKKAKTQTVSFLATKSKMDLIKKYSSLVNNSAKPQSVELYKNLFSKLHKHGF